ncbi:MAG: TIGR01621 family pseudouridine synthase [Nitrospiraceae bacterium]|nr:MAG: TIGR01621 family pseudouridine synthase [Nitrospiraceae bacterium]
MYKVISDHKGFIIVSKDPGVSFHKDGNSKGLPAVIREDLGIGTLYSVHRLDRMTSGLLVFAKTPGVAKELSDQFRCRTVEKYYLAISDRKSSKKQGTITGDMEKSRRGTWKLSRGRHDPAITSFFSCALGEGLRLYLLRPYTGKTHQLRVAMKSLGAPVLGDCIYAKKEMCRECDRGYLHSYGLRFDLRGKIYEFENMPDSGEHFLSDTFLSNMSKYRNPWLMKWPQLK